MGVHVDYLVPGDLVWPRPAGYQASGTEIAIFGAGGGGGGWEAIGVSTHTAGGGAGAPCLVLRDWPVGPSGLSVSVAIGGACGAGGEDGATSDPTTVTDIDQTYSWEVNGQPGGATATALAGGAGAVSDSSGMDGFIGTYSVYTGTNGEDGADGDNGGNGGNAGNSDGNAGTGTRNDGGVSNRDGSGNRSPGAGGVGQFGNQQFGQNSGSDASIRITYTTPTLGSNRLGLSLRINV